MRKTHAILGGRRTEISVDLACRIDFAHFLRVLRHSCTYTKTTIGLIRYFLPVLGSDWEGLTALEAVVPRACSSVVHDLELEIWEQNHCLSTSDTTARAPLLANEMSS